MAFIVYTLLRIALFALVWVIIELVTPIHGLWAAAAAILMSGAISLVVLDRPRNKVGAAAGQFFGRINDRIEASASAEDVDDDPAVDPLADPSGEREQHAEGKPVAEQ
jgi:hypothetical protein